MSNLIVTLIVIIGVITIPVLIFSGWVLFQIGILFCRFGFLLKNELLIFYK